MKKREELKALKEQQELNSDDEKHPMDTAITVQITDTRALSSKNATAPQSALKSPGKNASPLKNGGLPGPGAYNLCQNLSPEKIRNSYNAVGFGYHSINPKSTKEVLTNNKIGPGAYDLTLPKKTKAFTFGEKYDGIPLDHPKLLMRRKLVEKEFHEPEIMGPINFMGRSPGARISPPPIKDRKSPLKEIGPGSYNLSIPDFSPKVTIAGRRTKSIAIEKTPGPGEYKPEAVMNYLFPPLGKTISSAVTDLNKGIYTDVPGPGTYNPKPLDTIHAPKYFSKEINKK